MPAFCSTPQRLLAASAALCILTLGGMLTAAETRPPNIVFILADDLGFGDLGCYGQQQLATPTLDRLAAEGLRFTRHYAGSTVCAPSRSVLLTGLHTGHTPVRTNWDAPLPPGTPTVASLLKTAGYTTGCFGKWGVGKTIPEDDPNQTGFDRFYGYVDMWHAHNFFPPFLVNDGRREALSNDIIPGSDKDRGLGNGVAADPRDYAPEFIIRRALQFIDHSADKPFFLYLPLNTPHANNEGAGYGRGMEVADLGEFADRPWPTPEKGFARMLQNIDDYVARVLRQLEEHGLSQNTLVLFSSDNGPHQEGGHQVEFFDSNGPLRGHKRDLYEGGVRVPLIAWWPGQIEAGRTTDLLSGFQDHLPTLCELAGVDAKQLSQLPSDGISLVPTLLGKPQQKTHAYLYWEFYEDGGKQAVVDDRFRAVRLNWNRQPDGPLELYDLRHDLSEQTDVAAEHPEVVQRMRGYMAASHVSHAGLTEKPPEDDAGVDVHPIRFDVRLLTIDANEGCDVADVDGDGRLDVIAGRNWYHNNDWTPRPVRLIEDRNGYARSNGEWAFDVNQDGRPDVVSIDFFSGSVYWYENPGEEGLKLGGLWPQHLLLDTGYQTNEASFLVDLVGDAQPEWISNQWNKSNPTVLFQFTPLPSGQSDGGQPQPTLKPHVVGPLSGHGIGFGDINNDGREDILVGTGWYERPEGDPLAAEWTYHSDWEQHAACPMLVRDLDGDGVSDLITSQAHDFGIYWWRGLGQADGKLQFDKRLIDRDYSQAHCLHMADLDGDGIDELITGKRVRAHNGKDPGGMEPPVVKYYVWNQATQVFTGHVINRGQVGIGLQIRTADIDQDGDTDIVLAGKEGTQILFNQKL